MAHHDEHPAHRHGQDGDKAGEAVRDPVLAGKFRALRDDIDREASARNEIIATPPSP